MNLFVSDEQETLAAESGLPHHPFDFVQEYWQSCYDSTASFPHKTYRPFHLLFILSLSYRGNMSHRA